MIRSVQVRDLDLGIMVEKFQLKQYLVINLTGENKVTVVAPIQDRWYPFVPGQGAHAPLQPNAVLEN